MTHAYSEFYLSNAKDRLSSFFDYAINDCKLKPDWMTALFINTGYAQQFERGNPAYVAGMSGFELARAVILKAYGRKELPEPTHAEDCSPAYWAGWAVAEYQWFTGRRFKDIFERIPLSKIIGMYSVYHEMDITSFINAMEDLYKAAEGDSKLKRIRENRGLSQAELAEQSGVNLRNIQMYEQRGNDIDKAQARISDENIEILRDACLEKRDLAMVDLLLSTGIRVGELVNLNITDINFATRECVVYGKGDKERRAYFDAKSKVHIEEYLQTRKDDNPALFVSLKAPYNRLTISGVETRMRTLGRNVSVQGIHPHKFRRTMATRAIDKGMPIEQVQRLLGHQQIDTTLRYAMVNQENVKLSHRRLLG